MEELKRPLNNKHKQNKLFNIGEEWEQEWWGMPEFKMDDVSPQYSIKLNFLTISDLNKFAEITGLSITAKTDSLWFPKQRTIKPGRFEYQGPKTDSKYPICIPSKGRWDNQTTGKVLDKLGVNYKFFVEDTEADKYIKYLGRDKVIVLPFHDLGQGSIPARNFIWEWAKSNNYKRHWTVDDNINAFARCNNNRRLNVIGGGFFKSMEDFVDRYENIVMAGPHDKAFCPDRKPNLTPYLLNSRIYSCILLDTNLEERWRGRYNEDTDLSLRLLKKGYCTCLFRSMLMDKGNTSYGDGKNCGMKGGNTDNVYNDNDFRRKFAESLKNQHPDCVEIVWRWGRWHHKVDYSRFKNNKLIRKKGIVKIEQDNNYGMELIDNDNS